MRMTMWTERFDLHSHSTSSDGQHPASDVAQRMSDSGVRYWSLTDHDTISGWPAAWKSARKCGIEFIPGVEITCMPGVVSDIGELERHQLDRASAAWHLLAYFPKNVIDSPEIERFRKWLTPLGDGRVPRMLTMIQRLNDLGLIIDKEKVLERAGDSVGRPHLADEMVAMGYVENRQQAFDEWIGDGKPANVAREKPTIAEASRMVKMCGGITSLAHPLYYGVPAGKLVTFCQSVGVDAIECFHRSHPDAYRYQLWTAAKKLGLDTTCGSDFHGIDYNHIPGHMAVPIDSLPAVFTV